MDELVNSNPFRSVVDPHGVSKGDIYTTNPSTKGEENKIRNWGQQMVEPL